ncbi:MAG: AhpC/TSA family protein [Prevotella sp.]|nr:AhpC/TSA family protein [Prevotella sp.]
MKKVLMLTFAAIALVSCQHNSYKILGTAEGYQDGDTLLMSDIDATPTDTIIVNKGKFKLKGKADSVELGIIFAQKNPDDAVLFFKEPGTILLTLTGDPATSHVGGTAANDGMQELTTQANNYEAQILKLSEAFIDTMLNDAKRQAIVNEYTKIQKELTHLFYRAAEKNIDNEFGFFAITNLVPNMEPSKVRSLIEKMPERFRCRPQIKELEAMAASAEAMEAGQNVGDFVLLTPDGEEMSIMAEVRKSPITILYFWASWCQPCMKEMPFMVSLYEKYREQGLQIIGISLDEKHESWVKAIKKHDMNWPQVSDLKGWGCTAAEALQVKAIPHIIVLDQNGTILRRGLREHALESFLQQTISKQPAK